MPFVAICAKTHKLNIWHQLLSKAIHSYFLFHKMSNRIKLFLGFYHISFNLQPANKLFTSNENNMTIYSILLCCQFQYHEKSHIEETAIKNQDNSVIA